MRSPFFFLLFLSFFLLSCSSQEIPVILQVDRSCSVSELGYSSSDVLLEAEKFYVLSVSLSDAERNILLKDACVLRVISRKELPQLLHQIQNDLNEERDDTLRKSQFNKTLKKDILDKEELQTFLEEQTENTTVAVPYQLFVTPQEESVVSLASGLSSVQEIYSESLHWVWISDAVLHSQEEKWLYPEQFILDTPFYASNPSGRIASDCEEQANTLVSVLLASGYPVENVRVVLGLVDFEGTLGGHAWVQIYENGRWLDIEPTMGDYYDEVSGQLVLVDFDVPYTYFQYHEYPSQEIWVYYNNEYYLIPGQRGNAPAHWEEKSKSWLEEDLQGFERRPK